ncbi:exocyst complex component 3 [Brachionus plicatilis]|uniref:Exocyst complex component 3 n=1 Tax=Brachionus plicatilis TaxID=10195 RepID=A0A3M7S2H3_BRAPC|nr:exocyst complex component 3 [Brachionus plicatilis]
MESTDTLRKLKEQAETNALKRLQSEFSTPDQLEQIEQHILRNEKTKNMIESQLKSAIQSHFISVNSCMDQLKEINQNINEVKNTIYSIQEEYKTISHLENTLGELRKEATKHKQLKSAKENVQNILNVKDLAKKAEQYIEDNNLLLAHKCLFDMEKCKNDILEELGNPSENNHNIDDIKLVEEFFKKVKQLQEILHSNIFLVIKRMLEVSKSYPNQLVTALRVISREEALDEFWMKKKEETGFAPSDRPKRWKEECKETIKRTIETKIQGCWIDDRETNEKWFSNNLARINSRFLEDLEIVKKLCEPCFPPSYKIFDFYVENIIISISNHFHLLLDSNQLKDREFYILLSWSEAYKSEDFLGSPRFDIDLNKLPNILDDDHYKFSLDRYLEYTNSNIKMWFQNTLSKNYNEWLTNKEPLLIDGCYESNIPNDLYSMLFQQLTFTDLVKDDRFFKEFVKYILSNLNIFHESLRGKLFDFKTCNSKPNEPSNEIITRMIASSNDCLRLKSSILELRDRFDTFMDKDEIGGPNDKYELLGSKMTSLSELCLDFIVEEIIKCLDEQYFRVLLSREWLTNNQIIDTILNTSTDFMQDLRYLRPMSQLKFLVKWHNRIKVEFMKGFFQNLSITKMLRKCQFTDLQERRLFTSKVEKEVAYLEDWFKRMASTLPDNKNVFDFESLKLMNKIVSSDDLDFLYVEIASLVKKCPSLTSEMLFALLSLRGDVSRSEYKEKFEDCIKSEAPATPSKTGMKEIKVDEALFILKKELKIQ